MESPSCVAGCWRTGLTHLRPSPVGWRPYEVVQRLLSLDGRTVTIDLLTATSVVDDEPMAPALGVVHDVTV
jgi:hypothetical protein